MKTTPDVRVKQPKIEKVLESKVNMWKRIIPDKVLESKMTKEIKPYKETHQQGMVTIEKELAIGLYHVDLGVQIAIDGRIWICIDGQAVLRFKPTIKK